MRFLYLIFDTAVYFANSQLYLTFAWIFLACEIIISIVFLIKYLLRRG